MTRITRGAVAALLAALLAAASAQEREVAVCAPPTVETATQAAEPTAEEREALARSLLRREALARYQAALPDEPDPHLLMPVAGVRVAQVADTWGGLRDGGRLHEGQDIFAPRGTPVLAATPGYVYRVDTTERGGRVVWVAGAGGRRYYYAHLESWGAIEEGEYVTPDTVLGTVGDSGNALGTPTHLHFGIYRGSRRTCDREVIDPLPMLVDR